MTEDMENAAETQILNAGGVRMAMVGCQNGSPGT